MNKKVAICPGCHTKITCEGKPGEKVKVECPKCGRTGSIVFKSELEQLDFYPLHEPYAYAKILKNSDTLEKHYKVIEPYLSEEEQTTLNFIWETLMKTFSMRLDELEKEKIENYLFEQVENVIQNYEIDIDEVTKKKIMYYIKRESLGYGKIDPLIRDPNIEDISCDGQGVPIFIYHRKYGSLRSNIEFNDEEELSYFVIRLAQKCGKHISIAEPMLDATMPDGSRIQMTLSNEVTTKGSTFTIRKFRADPFTPPDLCALNTVSSEIMAYYWLAVENRINALIAGGTASGKTTILNALSLFIPADAKIVSIEETREINLPHPNWIPGVARTGFGEIVANKMVGEIDLYDLMKAALRQRPEYIIVGEIRGREAYVLFQAMATGHATYSTVHADSAKSLIHRLEGKPIDIPRIMLQSLDIVSIHITTRVKGKRVRRCKQIIEIIDIDPTTKEILTNEVFKWDPVEDKFIYTGKSYVLEGIRARWDMSKESITLEIRRRAEILEWMKEQNVRTFKEVAKVISRYTENPEDFLKKIKQTKKPKKEDKKIKDNKQEKNKKKEDEITQEMLEELEDFSDSSKAEKKDLKSIFNDLDSMDEETAKVLYENGYTSVDALRNTSFKELCKIKGIKKKNIKEIKKELENLEKPNTEEFDKQKINKKEIIEIFKDIKSIDNKTSILLYENGYKTIEDLKNTTIEDLAEIKGLKIKKINKIFKELEER